MKAPVALVAPLSTLELPVVGLPVVFQHRPCAVGLGTPRSVIVALPVASVSPMPVTACVVTVGGLRKWAISVSSSLTVTVVEALPGAATRPAVTAVPVHWSNWLLPVALALMLTTVPLP